MYVCHGRNQSALIVEAGGGRPRMYGTAGKVSFNCPSGLLLIEFNSGVCFGWGFWGNCRHLQFAELDIWCTCSKAPGHRRKGV